MTWYRYGGSLHSLLDAIEVCDSAYSSRMYGDNGLNVLAYAGSFPTLYKFLLPCKSLSLSMFNHAYDATASSSCTI